MKFDSLELANNLEKLKAVKLNNSIKNEDELSTIIDIKKNIRKYFYLVYPLGLYLILGLGVRWGITWMGGIMLYSYLFSIYFRKREM